MKRFITILTLIVLFTVNAQAATEKQRKTLNNAASVLDEILSSPDENIPSTLLKKAKAIIVFPTMVKGGFIFAARFGKGVATVRSPDTGLWGPPAFLTTFGGSFGFQIGGTAVDLILVVMSHRGIEGLMKGQFNLGADAGVAAGPIGRHAEAATDILAQGEIYSYSRSKGAFAGVSLKGTAISFDEESNEIFYGQPASPKEILFSEKVLAMPESGRRFLKRLNLLAPPEKTNESATPSGEIYLD